MKRVIAFMAVLVLAACFVSAQGQPGMNQPGTAQEQPEAMTSEPSQGMPDNASDNAAADQNQTGLGPKFGLENAMSRVKNERAREVLQRNLDRWMERHQERLNRMENVEISDVDEDTGAVEITAEEPVRWFGIIKGKAKKRFDINNNGRINERAPWYDFLYSEAE